jgi:hypothetical protein
VLRLKTVTDSEQALGAEPGATAGASVAGRNGLPAT